MAYLSVAGVASLLGSIIVYLAAKLTGRRTSLPLSIIAGLVIGVPISYVIDPIALLGIRGADTAALIIYVAFFAVLGGLGAAAIAALAGRPDSAAAAVTSSPLVDAIDITSILRKLNVNNRTQAVIYALRHGWIDLVGEVAV